MTKNHLNDLTYDVLGAAIEVHKSLGPGLLESLYHQCLKRELLLQGIYYESELIVPVTYKGIKIDTELRCDLYIERILVVELKAVEKIMPIHTAKLLTYMNLLNSPKGMLINFNCVNIFKDGQKTFVNDIYRRLPDE